MTISLPNYPNRYVVRTKLAPPRPHQKTLERPRLTQRLLEALDYRLVVVQARTGYGKTTALSALEDSAYKVVWYHLEPEDADPFVFLLHLLHGFRIRLDNISEGSVALLERWGKERISSSWTEVIDDLVNDLATHLQEQVILILDDVHHIREAPETLRILDRLIGRAPVNLHPIVSTRYPLNFPNHINWLVRGQVLEIGQDELAFTPDEITKLFRDHYRHPLSSDQVSTLSERVEGWPIALQLVWRRMDSAPGVSFDHALGQLSGATGELFNYLAREVLANQAADIQDFLKDTCILRTMTAPICDCLRSANNSGPLLRFILDNGLFAVDLGGGHLRYQFLFRDLLKHQLSERECRALHLKAARCYQTIQEDEEALYHLLAAGAFKNAAEIIEEIGREMVRAGRLDTLSAWIDSIPPQILGDHPPLLSYLGDIARLHSHFDEALGWYQQAEERSRARRDIRSTSQALRGQARVYLDTVNPSQAERLLQEALRLSDGQEDRESRARLLELLAENLLNRGQSDEAERFQAQVRKLREEGPAEAELSVRLLLRTGRLDEAYRLLQERREAERQLPVLRPRAHRETSLLLSIISAFKGDQDEAYRFALEGTERGQALNSPFITAVGLLRQGHAWALNRDRQGYKEARRSFEQAIAISEQIDVPRIKVEAYWGLAQAYGFQGDLENARSLADQGITLAQYFGDEWIEACIRLTVGASYALAQAYEEAVINLAKSETAFRDCSDSYGEAVARLWLCLVWHDTGDKARLGRDLGDMIRIVRQHGYDFLFSQKTLLGPPDPRSLVPLLVYARDRKLSGTFADNILASLGLAAVEIHPGYQLRIQTLGPLRTWRGYREIESSEWRRMKTRHLFLLLLINRHQMLDRDQVVEMLWPELETEQAHRDFKIALSGLYSVLEPDRIRNAPSAYIVRDGTLYGIRPGADIWLDIDHFKGLVRKGDVLLGQDQEAAVRCYTQALTLYLGDFLQEYVYEDWTSEERERMLTLFLRTAERVAGALVEKEDWDGAIEIASRILDHDDCWEQAYRLMMVAYAGQGNRVQAMRTYRRCVERLKTVLAVEPSPATVQLSQTIR